MFRRAAILILVTAALAACGGDPTDTGSDAGGNGPDAGGNQDTQAPTLLSSSPSNGTTGMAVGGSFTVTFSEPMDPQSVLLELRPSVGLGGASWNAEGTSVSYAPLVELSAGVTYSVTVSGKDLAGNGLTGTNSFSFTAAATDTTAPTVRTTTPATGATNVSPTAAFNISFSEPMDTGTVTVDLSPTASVELSWDAESTTLTALAPAGLAFGTSYTVTLNGKDVAGNALGGTTTFSFTTSTPADATAPEVASGSPANGTTGVSTSTNISVSFSESMDRLSVENALSVSPTVTCSFAWNTASTLVTCIPAAPLSFSTSYTVTLGTGAKDLANNALAAAHSFSFTTASAPDTTKPTVTGSTPANGSKGNVRASSITVVFSEPMDKASAQTAFAITSPTGYNAGIFTWNTAGTEMTFNPDADFAYGTLVSWSVSTAAKDLAGNTLASSVSHSFRVAYLGQKSLYSVATLDGSVYNDGAVYTTDSWASAGDVSSGKFLRAFYSFNLGELTGTVARINSATLYLYQSTYAGSPDTELGTFWVQSVDYGTSLDKNDFNLPVLQTFQCRFVSGRIICGLYDEQLSLNVSAAGSKSLTVTRKVLDDWNNRSTRGLRSQFRMRFATDVSYDSAGDYVNIYTRENGTQSTWPSIYVEYEYE